MVNMSYCRFRNTSMDLLDCFENWEETSDNELNPEELRARQEILELCENIVDIYSNDYILEEVGL